MMLAILVTCTRFKISPSGTALDIVRDIEERSNTFMKTFDNPIVISYHISNLIIRVSNNPVMTTLWEKNKFNLPLFCIETSIHLLNWFNHSSTPLNTSSGSWNVTLPTVNGVDEFGSKSSAKCKEIKLVYQTS